jgi:hypothetical protein
MRQTIKIFEYSPALDAFRVTPHYKAVAEYLGLIEWNPVVWIGQLFMLDNDYGEHWFDDWDLREAREDLATKLGIDVMDILVMNPDRMQNGKDGPCNTPEVRKQFWTDVLISLELSHELIFAKACEYNQDSKARFPEDYLADLEERIAAITAGTFPSTQDGL